MMFIFFSKPAPEDEPVAKKDKETVNEDDDMFDHRLGAFDDMGFDHLSALALAWNKVSPSEVREDYLKKRGWNKEQVLFQFLPAGEDD